MGTPSDENVTKTETNKTKNSDSTVGKERPTEDGELRDDNEDSNKGDEEDVPDDFFDDFSNQDFINGLDIVDAWEEVEKSKPKEETENEEKLKQRKRSKEPKSHGRKSRSAERGKRKRSEEKRRRSRERRPRENSFQSKRIPNERELRRDPVKTKRDVDKDRENYTKKQEQKLISKVVETGLVPPGMETEVNLSEIESTTKQEDKERDVLKREIVLKHSKEKESRDKSRERRRRRSKSFEKVSSTHRGRSRGRSSERRRGRSRGRQDRSREKLRWNRSRERYFGRDREVSPFSPLSRRRRSRSLSDRERWLKLRKSPSIERKYRGGIGEERMSFLEEIKMKLDGHSTNRSPVDYFPPTNYIQPVHNIYPTEPIQVAAPAPNQFFPPNPNSPYDQNFFIGDPKPVPPINSNSLNMPSQINGVPPAVLQPSPVQAPVLPTLQHIGSSFGPPSVDFGFTTQPVKPVPPPNPSTSGINNVSKLLEQIRASTNAKVNMQGNTFPILEDKKLSFTDFLSNNSRVSAFSSDSEALQKKVNVLSRCQDVLKELTGDKKFGGKLIVTRTLKNSCDSSVKNISPLLRREPIRFSYTTPTNQSDKSLFHKILNTALVKSGIIPEVIDLEEKEAKVPKMAPPPPAISKQKNMALKGESQVGKRFLMKMCQTDPVQCEGCEKRRGIQYKSIGIQCGETERYNVGVQVIETDIINSKIPKTQSLAYLTPAQLLGRGEITSTRVDNFSSSRQTPYNDYLDYLDRTRGYGEPDLWRSDYIDSQRFPRY